MTNRQLVLENIDRIDRLVYTPLERRYLRVRLVGTALTYIGLMVLPFFVFLADDFKGQDMLVAPGLSSHPSPRFLSAKSSR